MFFLNFTAAMPMKLSKKVLLERKWFKAVNCDIDDFDFHDRMSEINTKDLLSLSNTDDLG